MTETVPLRDGALARHVFTVDVEEYFHVAAFAEHVSRESWDRLPSRVEFSTHRLLEQLTTHDAFGTFFVLDWVAERHPALVRAIADAGHEVASHGSGHRRVNEMTPDELRGNLRRSKNILEGVVGRPVIGFRAPNFSITPGYEWAFDILLEEGFRYDSSLFPIHRSGYGYPAAPPVPHLIDREQGRLLELPLATVSAFGTRIPAAGGAYLRFFPFGLIRRAFRDHGRNGLPAVFYVHPWEIDPEQPRLPVSAVARVRHYTGLQRTLPRLQRLLEEFDFTSVERLFPLDELDEAGLESSPVRAHARS